MDYIMPISEVRGNLPELIKKIAGLGKHLIITKHGKPEAVMITPEELETLEIKSDPELLQSIVNAENDIKKGNLYSHDEVFKNV